jgi:hypothetical protein
MEIGSEFPGAKDGCGYLATSPLYHLLMSLRAVGSWLEKEKNPILL